MKTTHVFIVDTRTFKVHLEYMFAGTGAKDKVIDFNNSSTSNLRGQTENNLVDMMADSQRVREGDYLIFYLQQNKRDGIKEGKFYGVFKVKEAPSFLDNNDDNQYLNSQLIKSLTFRTLIKPHQVYPEGVTEWEALDAIKNIKSPNQMLWSLIYRKLKGNRGNTMITIYESDRLRSLIRTKNNRNVLSGKSFTFNKNNQKIEKISVHKNYNGRQEKIIVKPRLIQKYCDNLQFEPHLQCYILKYLNNINALNFRNVEWIGNEVSCGVGMQRIDLMISEKGKNRKIVPIELKSKKAKAKITEQLKRYIDWIEQYYIPNRPSDIEPMIIAREFRNKTSNKYKSLVTALNNFNSNYNTLKLRYIEFSIDCDTKNIKFKEINY